MMRLEIKTDGLRFRVAGTARPRPDYKDKDKQAVMRDGRPIWTVRLNAVDTSTEHGSSESIWVEVAGDEPRSLLQPGIRAGQRSYLTGLENRRQVAERYRSAVRAPGGPVVWHLGPGQPASPAN